MRFLLVEWGLTRPRMEVRHMSKEKGGTNPGKDGGRIVR
jgi:hypothetical protein